MKRSLSLMTLCSSMGSWEFMGVVVFPLYIYIYIYIQYRPKVWTHLLIQTVFFIFMTMKIVDSH